jgi:hypothetical protein
MPNSSVFSASSYFPTCISPDQRAGTPPACWQCLAPLSSVPVPTSLPVFLQISVQELLLLAGNAQLLCLLCQFLCELHQFESGLAFRGKNLLAALLNLVLRNTELELTARIKVRTVSACPAVLRNRNRKNLNFLP